MNASQDSRITEIVEFPIEHLRVLGPPGSGKTSLLLERYKYLSQKAGNVPRSVIIVTYSVESAARLVEAVLPAGAGCLGDIPVYRYFSLAKEVISAAEAAPRRMSEMEELILLDRVLHRIGKKFKSDYRSVYGSDKFLRSILELMRWFLQSGLGPDDVHKLARLSGLDSRLVDIFDLCNEFIEELRSTERRSVTDYDICWRAADVLAKRPESNPFEKTKVFLVDDFQDVDAGQFALLRTLAPPNGNAALNVFGDATGAHFRYRGTRHSFLMKAFPDLYSSETFYLPAVCQDKVCMGPVVDALLEETVEGNLHHYQPVQVSASSKGKRATSEKGEDSQPFRLRFRIARDEFDETLTVAANVKSLLKENRFQPQDIAIAAREKRRYEPLLSTAFHQYGIPLETGRTRSGPFEHFVFNLLRFLPSRDDEAVAESLLNSPFYPSFAKRCIPRIDVGSNDDRDDGAALAAGAGGIAEKVFSGPIEDWMGTLIGEFVIPALDELENNRGDISVYSFISKLLAMWQRYVEVIKKTGAKKTSALINDFLSKSDMFADRFAPISPAPGRVGFYSCHELKGICFPAVFLLGCSEMIFPAARMSEEFIPYGALAHLLETALPYRNIEVYAARSIESHLRDEFSLMFLALTRAKEMLWMTAPRRFDGREETVPTSIVNDKLPSGVIEESPAQSNNGEPDVPPVIHLASSMMDLANGDSVKIDAAAGGVLEGLSPVPLLWKSGQIETRSVLIPKVPLSPSSLKTFDTCERKYFYGKVLKLREEDTIAMKIGSLFHEVMRRLGTEFPSVREMHAGSAEERSTEILEAVLEEHENLRESALVDMSIRHHLVRMIRNFFEIDALRRDEYTIGAVERGIRFAYGGWDFTGRIDRLDLSQACGGVVIDYKTGTIDRTGATVRKRVLESAAKPEDRDWQIPIYSKGALSCGHRLPVVFSYYSIPVAKDPIVVSILIDKKEPTVDQEDLFDKEVPPKRFAHLLADELEQCLDDAVRLAERIYAPRDSFERTEESSRCRFCPHRDICNRSEGWN
ncbi:MAG: AAA family ATPase [Candidatus Latescibacteria bacterium]|nr:AAA family ATPase [Candidatus Latescibacterota bacterium]NIM22521.1 AAA family ATPase [Candidatus Latescibacterota bacterium]NIM64835.1 AAA family ATPase [Candidatus Latescibacterota bacterium]NIO01343.1 AAA family ATPase [Candidatus Latescibacterota bacterium]NIO27832.1 AAA family ATPase [Candidatus Latescibacterota bacterium]